MAYPDYINVMEQWDRMTREDGRAADDCVQSIEKAFLRNARQRAGHVGIHGYCTAMFSAYVPFFEYRPPLTAEYAMLPASTPAQAARPPAPDAAAPKSPPHGRALRCVCDLTAIPLHGDRGLRCD